MSDKVPYYFDVGEYIADSARGRRLSYRFDYHWNQLGNRLAADGIYKYLKRERLLPDRLSN